MLLMLLSALPSAPTAKQLSAAASNSPKTTRAAALSLAVVLLVLLCPGVPQPRLAVDVSVVQTWCDEGSTWWTEGRALFAEVHELALPAGGGGQGEAAKTAGGGGRTFSKNTVSCGSSIGWAWGKRKSTTRTPPTTQRGEGGTPRGRAACSPEDEGDELTRCKGCRRWFDSVAALLGHTPHCCGFSEPVTPDQGVAATPDQDWALSGQCLQDDLDNIQSVHTEEQASLHYEHHVSQATLQRSRESTQRVMKLQSAAIKDAIHKQMQNGGSVANLDGTIDTIMSCLDSVVPSRRMNEAQSKQLWNPQQSFTLQPRRRTLPNGGTMYDLPLEETVQRQLYMDPAFASYFTTDWGSLPRAPDGQYHNIQDGSVAQEHPELGKQDYTGPSRTGWALYGDALELAETVGTARGKHKVVLYYATCLNQPGHMRNELDYIFLVAVVLNKDQVHKDVGIQNVIDPGDGLAGTSFAASMRRLDRTDGSKFYVPAPAGSFVPRNFRGWLLIISADALAAAEFVGTKGSFGPKVKCFCWMCNAGALVGYKQIGSFLPRNLNKHQHHTERTQAIYEAQVQSSRRGGRGRVGTRAHTHTLAAARRAAVHRADECCSCIGGSCSQPRRGRSKKLHD